MEATLKLSKLSIETAVDQTLYMSLVGSLRYRVNTRPDLCFAMGYVIRFLEDHMGAVMHILRYVAGTFSWGLWYGRGKKSDAALVGYCDSDYAGDIDKRHITTGVIFFLANCPISWQSMKQKVVAHSSYEAEYIADANAAYQALWLTQVLAEIQGTEPGVALLRVDNKSAIALIKNLVLSGQSRHAYRNQVSYGP
jgi:hypothetical protein